MGDDDLGAPSLGKSVRSLLDALVILEQEIEILIERSGVGSVGSITSFLSKLASLGSHAGFSASSVGLGAMAERAGRLDANALSKMLAGALGLADAESLETLRREVHEVVEHVGRLRERELALAGGVSQLRSRSARFEEALAGLARVQGKCVARLDHQVDRAQKLEHLAARRDDHITRLIRDTAAQRSELERLGSRVTAPSEEDAGIGRERVAEIHASLAELQSRYQDLKNLHDGGTRRVIETLESMRDRVSKLELRAAEMSREARAKGGRIDALARHVASVEGRLTTAIGKRDDAAAARTDAEPTIQATG